MKVRCDRCHALIDMEESGMFCDGETAEHLYYRECPFCGRENHYQEELHERRTILSQLKNLF